MEFAGEFRQEFPGIPHLLYICLTFHLCYTVYIFSFFMFYKRGANQQTNKTRWACPTRNTGYFVLVCLCCFVLFTVYILSREEDSFYYVFHRSYYFRLLLYRMIYVYTFHFCMFIVHVYSLR